MYKHLNKVSTNKTAPQSLRGAIVGSRVGNLAKKHPSTHIFRKVKTLRAKLYASEASNASYRRANIVVISHIAHIVHIFRRFLQFKRVDLFFLCPFVQIFTDLVKNARILLEEACACFEEVLQVPLEFSPPFPLSLDPYDPSR